VIIHCLMPNSWTKSKRKVLTVFLLAIHIHLYLFKLTQPLTVSTVQLMYTVKGKGGKPYSLPYGLRNPYISIRSENFQDYAQKPQQNQNCTFMNLTSVCGPGSGHISQGRTDQGGHIAKGRLVRANVQGHPGRGDIVMA
jgi:hypothetical protein